MAEKDHWMFDEPRFVYVYTEMFEDYYEFRKPSSKAYLRLVSAKTNAVPGRRRDWVKDKTNPRRWELYNGNGEIVGEIVKLKIEDR